MLYFGSDRCLAVTDYFSTPSGYCASRWLLRTIFSSPLQFVIVFLFILFFIGHCDYAEHISLLSWVLRCFWWLNSMIYVLLYTTMTWFENFRGNHAGMSDNASNAKIGLKSHLAPNRFLRHLCNPLIIMHVFHVLPSFGLKMAQTWEIY